MVYTTFRTVKAVSGNDGRTAQIHDGGFIICQRDAATAEAFGDLVARDHAAAHRHRASCRHIDAATAVGRLRLVPLDHAVRHCEVGVAQIDAAAISFRIVLSDRAVRHRDEIPRRIGIPVRIDAAARTGRGIFRNRAVCQFKGTILIQGNAAAMIFRNIFADKRIAADRNISIIICRNAAAIACLVIVTGLIARDGPAGHDQRRIVHVNTAAVAIPRNVVFNTGSAADRQGVAVVGLIIGACKVQSAAGKVSLVFADHAPKKVHRRRPCTDAAAIPCGITRNGAAVHGKRTIRKMHAAAVGRRICLGGIVRNGKAVPGNFAAGHRKLSGLAEVEPAALRIAARSGIPGNPSARHENSRCLNIRACAQGVFRRAAHRGIGNDLRAVPDLPSPSVRLHACSDACRIIGDFTALHDKIGIKCPDTAAVAVPVRIFRAVVCDLPARHRKRGHRLTACFNIQSGAADYNIVACDHAAVDRQRRLLARIDAATIGRSIARDRAALQRKYAAVLDENAATIQVGAADGSTHAAREDATFVLHARHGVRGPRAAVAEGQRAAVHRDDGARPRAREHMAVETELDRARNREVSLQRRISREVVVSVRQFSARCGGNRRPAGVRGAMRFRRLSSDTPPWTASPVRAPRRQQLPRRQRTGSLCV